MTTITLEVPDEVAARFHFAKERWPAFIRQAIADKLAQPPPSPAPDTPPLYQEIVDFLASGPAAAEIIAFKISPTAQERLEDLLEKNRETSLRIEERAELETYLQLSHVVARLKARARNLAG